MMLCLPMYTTANAIRLSERVTFDCTRVMPRERICSPASLRKEFIGSGVIKRGVSPDHPQTTRPLHSAYPPVAGLFRRHLAPVNIACVFKSRKIARNFQACE